MKETIKRVLINSSVKNYPLLVLQICSFHAKQSCPSDLISMYKKLNSKLECQISYSWLMFRRYPLLQGSFYLVMLYYQNPRTYWNAYAIMQTVFLLFVFPFPMSQPLFQSIHLLPLQFPLIPYLPLSVTQVGPNVSLRHQWQMNFKIVTNKKLPKT